MPGQSRVCLIFPHRFSKITHWVPQRLNSLTLSCIAFYSPLLLNSWLQNKLHLHRMCTHMWDIDQRIRVDSRPPCMHIWKQGGVGGVSGVPTCKGDFLSDFSEALVFILVVQYVQNRTRQCFCMNYYAYLHKFLQFSSKFCMKSSSSFEEAYWVLRMPLDHRRTEGQNSVF